MNKTPGKLTLACFAAAAMAASSSAMADLTANADVTSNYVFRGESLSADHVAVQGGLDYAHESGLYAGVWGSNVDNRVVSATEYDVYAGISNELGPVTYDLAYLTYNYTDRDFLPNGREVKLGLKYGPGTFNYFIGDTGESTGNTYGYYELMLKFKPEDTVELSLRYGLMTGDAAKVVGAPWNDKDIADYGAALAKEIGGFKVSANYAEREHGKPKAFAMLYKEFKF